MLLRRNYETWLRQTVCDIFVEIYRTFINLLWMIIKNAFDKYTKHLIFIHFLFSASLQLVPKTPAVFNCINSITPLHSNLRRLRAQTKEQLPLLLSTSFHSLIHPGFRFARQPLRRANTRQ